MQKIPSLKTTNLWLDSLRNLKSLCLVFKPYYASAVLLLYKHIRLRRIPQLSALVASLQSNHERVSNSQSFSPPVRLGDCTQSFDLFCFIPKEWNTLYVSDLLTLLPMLPNLTSFCSRPCLPVVFQSGARLPRPVPAPFSSPSRIRRATIPSLLSSNPLSKKAQRWLISRPSYKFCLPLYLTLGFHKFYSGSELPTISN